MGLCEYLFRTVVIIGHKIVSAYDINYIFPLYIYNDTDKKDLFINTESQERRPNINPEIFQTLTDVYGEAPTPESIFSYIYAVLYSNIYRDTYAEFLKVDFPRVPFTKDYGLFREVGVPGRRLVELHLLKSPELDQPIAKFQQKHTVNNEQCRGLIHQTPSYDEPNRRVHINKYQYFEGVSPDVWDYRIGGYQVCRKCLKDRKGRKLSLDDIKHYCRVVTALAKTIEIQNEIDELYPDVEKDIVDFIGV